MNEQAQPDSPQRAPAPDQIFAPSAPFSLKRSLPKTTARRQSGQGRRSRTTAAHPSGHFLRAIPPQDSLRDLALAATLRASALRRATPLLPCSPAPHPLITPADLRVKLRRARTGNLILFVVDASGSMGARKRMIAVKGAILSLLLDAYQKRDRVGLITFRGPGASLLVPPTNSVELAERQLRQMPTGGQTPLATGLRLAGQVVASHLQRDAALTPLLVIVTDGRVQPAQQPQLRQAASLLARQEITSLVLDSEQGLVRLGLAQELAGWINAHYLLLDELRAETIAGRVKERLARS